MIGHDPKDYGTFDAPYQGNPGLPADEESPSCPAASRPHQVGHRLESTVRYCVEVYDALEISEQTES